MRELVTIEDIKQVIEFMDKSEIPQNTPFLIFSTKSWKLYRKYNYSFAQWTNKELNTK